MQARASPLFRVPIEILERIGLEVALLSPLGPPVDLIPLLCTCKYVNYNLSFHRSKDLYAKIFRGMFDVDAPRRRFGRRAIHSRFLASQLKTYCITLQRIRRGDISSPDVEDILRTAFILLTENDGKNRAQLEWANTYSFVNNFVRHRLWQDSVNGWPRDTPLHSLALWVMWCMTDGGVPPSTQSIQHPFPSLLIFFQTSLHTKLRMTVMISLHAFFRMLLWLSRFVFFFSVKPRFSCIFFSIFHILPQITISFCHCRGSGSAMISSHYKLPTVNILFSLHEGIPYQR